MLEYLRASATFFWEVIKVAVVSLAIILPIRYLLVQPFYVKGASMEPTYLDHDYLLIDELSFRFREPSRGEVVVLRYPRDPGEFFIKRIVGLPGERVVVQGGRVLIGTPGHEPVPLAEPYLPADHQTNGNVDVTLSDGQYYVFGDNRSASLDSRSFGPITSRAIIGRTWVRAWPPKRAAVFPTQPLPVTP